MVRGFQFSTMATGLAVLGIVRAITIDNHLMPIITDCYERLAIGERLHPDNVYKFFNYNTVAECKQVCSGERKSCKAFAFGISSKGNATCELSIDAIKETADLKPIGTIHATDFDLYIKKLDCTLVIENVDKHPNNDYHPSLKPVTLGNIHIDDEFHHDPLQIAPGIPVPPDKPPHASDSSHQYLSASTNHHNIPPPIRDGVHNVQTLVSIASGPQSILNPIHGILVGQESSNYGGSENHPPFKPASLNRPYDDHETRPHLYDRPNPDYEDRPGVLDASVEYVNGGYLERPHWPVDRPELDRLDMVKPWNSAGYNVDRYGDRPSRIPFRPEPSFLDSHRPLPNKYGSVIPHPDEYDNLPTLQSDYLFQQSHQESFSEFYQGSDHRPPRPFLATQGYHGDTRPANPPQAYGNRDQNTDRYTDYAHQRPSMAYQGYGDGNQNTDRGPNYFDARPSELSEDNPNDYPHRGPSTPGTPSQSYEDKKPVKPRPTQQHSGNKPYDDEKPLRPISRPFEGYGESSRKPCCGDYPDDKVINPIVSHSTGHNGEQITSIITQIEDACFRRVLAGKRVSRGFVKRASICETVEECQKECADEKRFSCEGFNYRLDPTGRGKGECELIDHPLARLDIGRDLYPHPDYDYYERDRNAASANCDRRWSSGDMYGTYGGHHTYGGGGRPYGEGYGGSGDGYGYNQGSYADRRHGYGDSRRPLPIDYSPPLRRPSERWPDDAQYTSRRPLRPAADYDRRQPSYDDYERRRPSYADDYDYRQGGNRRGDFSHHTQDHYHQSDGHYLPPRPVKPSTFEPYLPLGYYDYQKRKDRLDYTNSKNHYLPPTKDAAKPWGLYDSIASADRHNHYGSKNSYNYWTSDRYGSINSNVIGGSYLSPPVPIEESRPYLHSSRPVIDRIGLPPLPTVGGGFVPVAGPLGGGGYSAAIDSASLPAEPRRLPTYNFIKDECSLRSATGFRLHKGIVKKFYAVPSIHECELLCFREKYFPCSSYAFRYTINLSKTTDNCYLSNRNHKELDYYTDLEPDKDFDIYTMNNKNRCEEPILSGRDTSDCFWRVRSGQLLDHKIVRDTLIAKSIVDCQIECLKSTRFTCRAFSYRYGSPSIGGPIDNCQLTDWPFYELDPRIHFIPEAGFEVYERGSFGHGCEPHHFGIRGQYGAHKSDVSKADQLCYIGFGSPARLLPQATKKSLIVHSELECREECSRARTETLFQCMSFSFRTGAHQKNPHNCFLSDIYQRDLLPKLDYIYDPDFWLFAWDNYNPECVSLASDPLPSNHIGIGGGINHVNDRNDFSHALDTWRVYSVSGWPCRRGVLCEENREAGFWSCELEGGDKGTWDYCCRPDHRCGASHGYPYQWCYVGPSRTQWRKCSDRYFPYIHNIIDRLDTVKPYLPPKLPWSPPKRPWTPPLSRPGARPDRPPGPPRPPHAGPTLDQYETAFDEEFLDPPKPGGFGQPRHWPVSYLHKEMPPNITDSRLMRMEAHNPKYEAIQNLIEAIKSNDLQNVQYNISNESNRHDDILFVKIPLPVNFTKLSKTSDILSKNTSISLEPVDVKVEDSIQRKRSHDLDPISVKDWNRNGKSVESTESNEKFGEISRPSPLYRRAFIARTNVTTHGRRF